MGMMRDRRRTLLLLPRRDLLLLPCRWLWRTTPWRRLRRLLLLDIQFIRGIVAHRGPGRRRRRLRLGRLRTLSRNGRWCRILAVWTWAVCWRLRLSLLIPWDIALVVRGRLPRRLGRSLAGRRIARMSMRGRLRLITIIV